MHEKRTSIPVAHLIHYYDDSCDRVSDQSVPGIFGSLRSYYHRVDRRSPSPLATALSYNNLNIGTLPLVLQNLYFDGYHHNKFMDPQRSV